MVDGEDIDAALIEQLTAVVDLFKLHEVSLAEAEKAFEKILEDVYNAAAAGGDDLQIESAWPGLESNGAKSTGAILGAAISHFRKKGPSIRIGAGPGPDHRSPQMAGERRIEAMADGLLARIDRRHKPTIGREYAALSLAELAMTSERAAGRRPLNMQEAVRMATHSTSDFAAVLENALGKSVARQMEQITPALQRAAHDIPAEDYRGGKLIGLSGSGMPQEVGEGGEIKHVTIDESGERKPAPRDFGALFSLSNKAIYNDDTGIFGEISKKMVAGSTERFRRVLLEPVLANAGLGNLMADGNPVFHASHGNLAASGAALDVTSLSAARVALRSQRGTQGEYYAIEPWALVVPPQLETKAQQLMAEINATKFSDANPFSGALEIIVEVGLTDPLAWYLIGNPASHDGLAYSYLDGQAAPRVESKPGWNTLGVEFRLVWAVDARFVSWASWYKNPGA
ncbi:Mu-like prophage major head subunit gpT family protein [Fertoebacter nigrum]|uniref:Mu-like prophage major head subunit gpT family protein n=1 Tax=Fertoeibacter niger TaxID=2656921 RepID=A0A8X8KN44_9RHOB|nr:Mu-like prophage major head subunit gpT family protein [Fertoeibacter niger]NUB43650.1 Mu-like prophage major head subunit gpT family protein [Fertoeibacter niger]